MLKRSNGEHIDHDTDKEYFIFPILLEKADDVCIRLNNLIKNGQIPKDKIFYKYLDSILYAMILYSILYAMISAYNLRGKDILKLPKVNTTKYGLKSWRYYGPKLWRYYGPKLWNSLPDSVKSLTTYAAFRKALVNTELEL